MAAVGGFDSTVRYCLAVTMGGGSLKLIANRSGAAIKPEYCEDAGRIIPFQDQRDIPGSLIGGRGRGGFPKTSSLSPASDNIASLRGIEPLSDNEWPMGVLRHFYEYALQLNHRQWSARHLQ